MAENLLDTLVVRVSADTKQATQGIKQLTSAFRSMRQIFKGSAEENKVIIASMDEFARVLTQIASIDFSGVENSLTALAEISKSTSKNIKDVLANAQEMDFGYETPTGQPTQENEPLEESWINSLQTITPIVQSFNTEFGNTSKLLYDLNEKTQNLSFTFEGIKEQEEEINVLTKFIDDAIVRIKGRLKFQIVKSIVNTIFKIIKEVVDNLYKASDIVGGSFAQSLDDIKTSFEYLINSVGKIVAPIVETLAPVLANLLDILAETAQTVGTIMETVFGSREIVNATKEQKKYNEELAKTTSLGIDELNILDEQEEVSGLEITGDIGKAPQVAEMLNDIMGSIGSLISTILSAVEKIIVMLKPTIDLIFEVVGQVAQLVVDILEPVLNIVVSVLDIITPLLQWIFEVIKPIVQLVSSILVPAIKAISKMIEGILFLVKGILWVAIGFINAIIRGINHITQGLSKLWDWTGIPAIPAIAEISLPTFATGGFPEDGLFMANRNELVGRFANGKTAVANNAQIVEGIKQGVIEAMQESGGTQNIILEVDGETLTEIVNDNNRRKGYSGIGGAKYAK